MIIFRFAAFFALFLVISPVFAKHECFTFIDKLKENKGYPAAQTYEEKIYFSFSGMRGRNDLGQREDCEANPTRRYFILGEITHAPKKLHSKSYHQEESGICVPDFCTMDVLGSDAGYLLKLAKINNFHTRNPLALYDPNAEPPRDMAYYIFVALFFILAALCLASTFIQNQSGILKKLLPNKGPVCVLYRPHWIFRSFDMASTLKSLYSTAKESGQSDHLSMFGFIRVFSIFWIVAFHTMVLHREINPLELTDNSGTIIEHFLRQGDLGPELFFFMAGFLAAFTLVGKATREGTGLSNFLSDCWHRFLRTYPGYIVSLIFFWLVMPGMMNGSLWNRYLGSLPVCEERWGQKFLLYGNFFQQPFALCAAWSWYIFTDLHLYPLVILMAYMYASKKYSKKTTYAVVCVLTVLSFLIGVYLVNMKSDVRPKFRWYNFSPARAGHVLVGVLFGFQYYEYAKLKLKNNFLAYCESNAYARYLLIFVGTILSGITIFVSGNDNWEFARRYVITIATPLMFMPLANDCSSIFKKILNVRFFQVLGKLSFGIFLLHWTIIIAVNYTDNVIPRVFDFYAVMSKAGKVALYSLAAALVYHFLFEKPLLNIENHFTKRRAPAKPTPSSADGHHLIINASKESSSPQEDLKDSERDTSVGTPDTKETEAQNESSIIDIKLDEKNDQIKLISTDA